MTATVSMEHRVDPTLKGIDVTALLRRVLLAQDDTPLPEFGATKDPGRFADEVCMNPRRPCREDCRFAGRWCLPAERAARAALERREGV